MWRFRPDLIYQSSTFSKPRLVARFFKITALFIFTYLVVDSFYSTTPFAAIWPTVKAHLGLFALFFLLLYMFFVFPFNRYTYKITFDGRSVNYSFGHSQGVILLKNMIRVDVDEVRGWDSRFWIPFAPDVVKKDGVVCCIASSGPAIKIFTPDENYLLSCRNPTALKAILDEYRREREAETE